MRICIAFAELCDVADAAGMHIELSVSPTVRDAPNGGEYRDLTLLAAVGDDIVVCAGVFDGDVQTAAAGLLEQLRRALGGRR